MARRSRSVAVARSPAINGPTDPGPSSGGHWFCRIVDVSGRWQSLVFVRSAAQPDLHLVELRAADAARLIGDDALCVAVFDLERRVTGVQLTPLVSPKAPPMWFYEFRETAARPPAVHLLAFTGHAVRPGSLLDEAAVTEIDVDSAAQLGAVRLYPATGEVDQVYVAPPWRRCGIGAALIFAASTLARARDWPTPWSDGQRTELGELFRAGQPWRDRAAPLTHIAPPMTPPTAG